MASSSHGEALREKGEVLIRSLGKGQFGEVFLCENDHLPGLRFAIKIVQENEASREEARILCLINGHPNIVPFYGYWEYNSQLCIRMGYVEGLSMLEHLLEFGPFTEQQGIVLFKQLVEAVQYVHTRHRVIHRDIKAENLLLSADSGKITLLDWGLATEWSPERLLTQMCGSPHYAAPEIFLSQPYTGPAIDMWSCGVVLYAMLTGWFPFPGETVVEIAHGVLRGKILFPPQISTSARDLIERILCKRPDIRLNCDQILTHPWMNQPISLACLSWPPDVMRDLRLRAQEEGLTLAFVEQMRKSGQRGSVLCTSPRRLSIFGDPAPAVLPSSPGVDRIQTPVEPIDLLTRASHGSPSISSDLPRSLSVESQLKTAPKPRRFKPAAASRSLTPGEQSAKSTPRVSSISEPSTELRSNKQKKPTKRTGSPRLQSFFKSRKSSKKSRSSLASCSSPSPSIKPEESQEL